MKGSLFVAAAMVAGASAQSCVYPTAAVLSGYEGSFTGTLSASNNRLGFNIVCGSSGTMPVNQYAALIRLDLPAIGSPVTIDTCSAGISVDTMISAG